MSGTEIDGLVVLGILGVLGLTGLMVMLQVPRLALIGWIVVIAFVPIWWGLEWVGYWYPGSLLGLGVLIVLFRDASWGRVTAGDIGFAVFLLAALAPIMVRGAWSPSAVFVVATQWALAFLIGRLALSVSTPDQIYRAIGIIFGIVAALAIMEFLLNFNPFIALGGRGAMFGAWNDIYVRGGLPRAEGAWGHSIALGAALSMSIPLLLASSLRTGIKIALLVVTMGGVAVTLSRIGQITMVLALVLSFYAMAPVMRRGMKTGLAFIMVIGGIIGYSFISGVFSSSGDEFAKSAQYRGDLLSLVSEIQVFGQSSVMSRDVGGDLNFGGYESIDNALLLLGLKHGWLALGVALLLAAGVMMLVLLRKAEPPTVALATQVPALFAVALITQFSMYFWFMAGLAVAVHAHRAPPDVDDGNAVQPSTAQSNLAVAQRST